MNRVYRRTESDWIGHSGAKEVSENYWRANAREVFLGYPDVEIVEIVHTGRKLDSELLVRGRTAAPAGMYVIVASTGGKWGRGRIDFHPPTP